MVLTDDRIHSGRRFKIIVGLVLVVVLIACTGIAIQYKNYNNPGITHSPEVALDIDHVDQYFITTVGFIENQSVINTLEWLDFDELGFLVMHDGYLSGGLESIYKNLSSPYNIASGLILPIVNNSQGDVSFADSDNNGYISINDTFYFKGDTAYKMSEALNDTGWIRFYLIFEGDLNGGLDQVRFIELGMGELTSVRKMG